MHTQSGGGRLCEWVGIKDDKRDACVAEMSAAVACVLTVQSEKESERERAREHGSVAQRTVLGIHPRTHAPRKLRRVITFFADSCKLLNPG